MIIRLENNNGHPTFSEQYYDGNPADQQGDTIDSSYNQECKTRRNNQMWSMMEKCLMEALPYDTVTAPEYADIEANILFTAPNAAQGGLAMCSEGKLYKFAVSGCTGMWLENDALWLAKARADHLQILIFEPGKPMRTLINSRLGDIHDVRIVDGQLYVVSTATNEVAVLAPDGSINKTWKFPGIGDSWHINCLDVQDGKLVLSAFGKFATYRGYKGKMQESGIVFELDSQAVLESGFSSPHTPRKMGEGMYLCNSKEETLVFKSGSDTKSVRFPGAFTRGLAFSENEIYVGLSSLRHRPDFKSIEGQITSAQIGVVDRHTFELKRKITVPQLEIYDIVTLENGNGKPRS